MDVTDDLDSGQLQDVVTVRQQRFIDKTASTKLLLVALYGSTRTWLTDYVSS